MISAEESSEIDVSQLSGILREMERLKAYCRKLEQRLDSQEADDRETESEEGKAVTPAKTQRKQLKSTVVREQQPGEVVVPVREVASQHGVVSAQQSPSSGDGGVFEILTRATMKTPGLISFEKSNVRKFMKDYEDYKMRFPMMAQKPQEFLRGEDLWYLSEFSGQDQGELREMDENGFLLFCCQCLQPQMCTRPFRGCRGFT